VIKPIDPGSLRTPVILQSVTTSKDSVGQPIETWTDLGTLWARVSPLSAREQWWASQTQASTTHQVTIRYDARVVPTARLKIAGTSRILNIESVRNLDEMNVYMVVSAIETVPSE
jgi:SPP1 family predicted phage head-tail adaptor